MNYKTYQPHSDLESLVKFYWTLEVPFDKRNKKQKIVPDGCIEMTFNLGDKIKRFVNEKEFIFNANAMVMGQRTKPFYILPAGNVDTIAICFYPYGFANFVTMPLEKLVDKEVAIAELFGQREADELEQQIVSAPDTQKRIELLEAFLMKKLNKKATVSKVVRLTVDTLLKTKGSTPVKAILKDDVSKRRQLERHFKKQIGISAKQLGKVIRLQASLQMLLNSKSAKLTDVAYSNEYFDQNHFIKDFKEFVGVTPKEFSGNENMILSSVFYR